MAYIYIKNYFFLLATWRSIRAITRPWKLGRPVLVPRKLLRPNRPRTPSIRRIPHPMIHNPIFRPIGTFHKTRMTNTVRFLERILVEDTTIVNFAPVLRVHRVITSEFELAETIIAIIGPGSAVDDELLLGFWIGELLRGFIRGETIIYGAAVGRLFPRV